ncbi:MAG: hypothetical protein ACLFO5_07220, partial [Opitutales bacterium]
RLFGLRERATRTVDAFYLRHAYATRDPLSSPALLDRRPVFRRLKTPPKTRRWCHANFTEARSPEPAEGVDGSKVELLQLFSDEP